MDRKESKKNLIRSLFLSEPSWTKPLLAKQIGVSTVTMNILIDELLQDGEIVADGKERSTVGRPSTIYRLNAEKFTYLLVSIVEHDQALRLEGRLIDGRKEIVAQRDTDYPDITLPALLDFIKGLLLESLNPPLSVAIAIPGKSVDGMVAISWWDKMNGWRIEEAVTESFHVPAHIENDANLATIGFAHRLGIDSKEGVVGLYYPHLSRPGASVFYDEQLISGTNSLAGEVKYLPFFSSAQTDAYTLEQEVDFTVRILVLYTVLLAPKHILVHIKDVAEMDLRQELAAALKETGTPVKPELLVSEDYEEHVYIGLMWLAQKELPFKMRRNVK